MKFFAVLLALVSLTLQAVATTPLYASCAGIGLLTLENGIVPGLLSTVTGLITNLLTTTVLGNECKTTCIANNHAYSVFAQGIDLLTDPGNPTFLGLGNLLGTCYCSDTDIAAAQSTPGDDSDGGCTTGIANLIKAQVSYLVPNSFDFTGCISGSGVPAGYTMQSSLGTSIKFSGMDTCAVRCGATLSGGTLSGGAPFVVRPVVTQGCGLVGGVLQLLLGRTSVGYECACKTGTAGTTSPGTCNGEASKGLCLVLAETVTMNWNTYGITNNPSGITRRNVRIGGRTPHEAYCPRPYIPCKLESGGAFECVDIASELESCGGCPFGDQVYNSTSGEDCTQIAGSVLGGVSCVGGKCQVSRCRSGFVLSEGRCVRKLNTANTRRRR